MSQDRGVKAVLDKARNLLRNGAGSLDTSRTIDSLAMTESSIKKVHVGGSGNRFPQRRGSCLPELQQG